MRGTTAFLAADERPNKRALQRAQYKLVGDWLKSDLGGINVVDMPSMNTNTSLEMMDAAGIDIAHYWAIEYEKKIAASIARALVLRGSKGGGRALESHSFGERDYTVTGSRDVLEVLSTAKAPKEVHFYNLDFCGAMGPSWRAFTLPHCLRRTCADKFAVCLTFSPRSSSKPGPKVEHVINVIAPQFYGLKPVEVYKNTYKDTSAMASWLAFFKKEQT